MVRRRNVVNEDALAHWGLLRQKKMGQNMISKYKSQLHTFYQSLHISFNLRVNRELWVNKIRRYDNQKIKIPLMVR